jgi:hypothetical protein
MIEDIETRQPLSPSRQETTRAIDTAVGILVGWRGSSTHSAFRELISASERHRIPIFALADALVNLAERDVDDQPADSAAQRAAEREWGGTSLAVAGTGTGSYPREIDRWL